MKQTCANCRYVLIRHFEEITIGFCLYYRESKGKLPFWSDRQASMVDLHIEGMNCATWKKKQ